MKRTPSVCVFWVLIFVVCVSVLLSSCKKNTGPSEPVISLTSPSDTSIIHAGDTVLIKGTVSDNKSLHELYFTFRNTSIDSVFFTDHPYVHGAKLYSFRFVWYPSSSAIYKLTIDAQDHDENTSTKDFLFAVN